MHNWRHGFNSRGVAYALDLIVPETIGKKLENMQYAYHMTKHY